MAGEKPPKPDKPKLWKDYLDRKRVAAMARVIKQVYPRFDDISYVDSVVNKDFAPLELKDRIHVLADGLKAFFPRSFRKSAKILIGTAPHLGDFENWVLTAYVERHGLECFEESVIAMRELTKYGSSEFAIRPFMIRYTDRMMPVLHEWAEESNEHVRRLAAEGSRPRGVWVAHLDSFKRNPKPVLELLEKLKADPSLYVRKAVANNLNDISKDHPNLVLKTGRRWLKDQRKETDWIVRHACRTLLKQGHPDALALFGFTSDPRIRVVTFETSRKSVKIGSEMIIRAEIESRTASTQKLTIDYRVSFLKANGNRSPKLFKWAEKIFEGKSRHILSTRHSFRNLSTRRHYPGKHAVELVINGVSKAAAEFSLHQ